jgi:sugar/nucleoside kinase (ribokinase family)
MATAQYDVIGIGNAIVDVLAQTDEAFLAQHGLSKGVMTLIDAGRAHSLYEAMASGIEMSGGSAANTLAGIASLGGTGAYIGKVRNDQLGGVFSHDLRAIGVDYRTVAATKGPPTARCLIFVTPDAQRTMQTFLGVSVELDTADIDEAAIGAAQVTYLEGYLFDPPRAKEAFIHAAEIAHAKGRKVALTLSDPFCVDRHRAAFQHLVEHHVDILFANELELLSLYESYSFEDAIQGLKGKCEIAAVTRSEMGSVIAAEGKVYEVKAEPVQKVVDTTGAGDLYAAGVLYGVTRGYELPMCGRIGSIAAAEVISHYGARPETALARLIKQKLG